MGNIVNRVFDSSGPEGKVRGTPQQIIEKYQQLARDAQLGNDRVAMENFLQHAEHYARMLGEALREQEANRRDYPETAQPGFAGGQPQFQPLREPGRPRTGEAPVFDPPLAAQGMGDQPDVPDLGLTRDPRDQRDQRAPDPRGADPRGPRAEPRESRGPEAREPRDLREPRSPVPPRIAEPVSAPQPAAAAEVIDLVPEASEAGDSGLVETPETAPKPRRPRTRKPKAPRAEGEAPTADRPEAAE
jgi:hypothetical protein